MGESIRVTVRELRNHVSEVLRRVERGETLEVTVQGRPVALLTPIDARPQTMPASQFFAGLRQADPGLRTQLAAELRETTDNVGEPWEDAKPTTAAEPHGNSPSA
jgi:prevent-host-death family protein